MQQFDFSPHKHIYLLCKNIRNTNMAVFLLFDPMLYYVYSYFIFSSLPSFSSLNPLFSSWEDPSSTLLFSLLQLQFELEFSVLSAVVIKFHCSIRFNTNELFADYHKMFSVLQGWSCLWSQHRSSEKCSGKNNSALVLAFAGQLLTAHYVPPDQHKQLLCEYKQSASCFLMCEKMETGMFKDVWKSLCISAGRGGDSAESCRRPGLCSSPPSGSFTQPLSVYGKVSRQVRNLHTCSTLSFFISLF